MPWTQDTVVIKLYACADREKTVECLTDERKEFAVHESYNSAHRWSHTVTHRRTGFAVCRAESKAEALRLGGLLAAMDPALWEFSEPSHARNDALWDALPEEVRKASQRGKRES